MGGRLGVLVLRRAGDSELQEGKRREGVSSHLLRVALKRKEILTLATGWTNLEDTVLCEPVTKKQTLWGSTYMRRLEQAKRQEVDQ